MKLGLVGVIICAVTTSWLVTVVDASAQGIQSRSASQSPCPGNTAKAPVRGYYAAVVRHDARGAKSCLTSYYAHQLAQVIGPDWQNVATLRSLKVTEAKALPHDTLPGNVPSCVRQALRVCAGRRPVHRPLLPGGEFIQRPDHPLHLRGQAAPHQPLEDRVYRLGAVMWRSTFEEQY